jgi:hypothetical protein
MARARKVESKCGAIRFAKSVAHSRELRDQLVEKLGCRKKDVSIDEEVEIPTKKDELIDFLNELLAPYDGTKDDGVNDDGQDD